MPGVKRLIRYQQALAAETGVAFWNMFEAMGGEGSMVEMVNHKPQMANYDYTHINFRGGKHIAGLLFETLMYGKEQYENESYEWSEIRFGISSGLWGIAALAQDALPEKSRPDRHSGHVSDSEAMQQLMRFVEVSNPMPAGFKGTTEIRLQTYA